MEKLFIWKLEQQSYLSNGKYNSLHNFNYCSCLRNSFKWFCQKCSRLYSIVASIATAITIVGCMFTLSLVMKTIPVGITYASFAGLCIIATSVVGVIKFNQMPDLYTLIGLSLIIAGVLIVNLIGKTNI